MELNEFNVTDMGAKSNNLKIIREKLPKWINLPESICLPF